MKTDSVRKIVHVDMDAFTRRGTARPTRSGACPWWWAARRIPARGLHRELRSERYGVHSAMPAPRRPAVSQAIFVAPVLGVLGGQPDVHDISRTTPTLSAPFLERRSGRDGNKRGRPSHSLAMEIRERVRTELHLTVFRRSELCKFLAKIASDLRKPDGLSVIL